MQEVGGKGVVAEAGESELIHHAVELPDYGTVCAVDVEELTETRLETRYFPESSFPTELR